MTDSDSPTAATLSTLVAASSTASSGAQKHHCRSTRKKRTTKLITIFDHNISFKPNYANKPDPAAPMTTRPCTECGKRFWSWKALFGHMRCHPERQWRGINPPPNLQRQSPAENQLQGFMTEAEHEVAACLLLLANVENVTDTPSASSHQENCRFECSSCKKVFGSHQALGGHRASHKNVKGCFAITRSDGDDEEDESEMMMVLEEHKCGICLRVFSSGQALGGHKRCHWEKGLSNYPFAAANEGCGVDLNLPAPLENDCSSPITLDLRLRL